jgi:uncharacterized protein (DUF302 family)
VRTASGQERRHSGAILAICVRGPPEHQLHNPSPGVANPFGRDWLLRVGNAGNRRKSERRWGSDMSKELGFNVELPLAFDAAVTRAREALKQEGFGVLTEIDLRAAFREKLGREFRPYVILGACNPPLAFTAISADPSIGLLLPCNVTVEWLAEGRTGVRLTDPEALLSTVVLQGAPELTSVARNARERMVRVAESLAKV